METKKNQYLQIRLTQQQKHQIKEMAAQYDCDMSTWVLSRVLNEKSQNFCELVNQLSINQKSSMVYAQLNDFLTERSTFDFVRAVELLPDVPLTDLQKNYLAAMVEYRANQLASSAPVWTQSIPPLTKPFFSGELASLRLYLLLNSPLAFRRRNIFIDSSLGNRE